jgi:hypothetical protein
MIVEFGDDLYEFAYTDDRGRGRHDQRIDSRLGATRSRCTIGKPVYAQRRRPCRSSPVTP